MDLSSPVFSLALCLIAFDLEIKVTFLVDSAFSARSSADLNSASMFDFILFFCSFKSFSSSRTVALFCPLLCSTSFLFSSSRHVWYLCLEPGTLYSTILWMSSTVTVPFHTEADLLSYNSARIKSRYFKLSTIKD